MPFSNITKLGPPSAAEIEITVFGPNYGESIVAHLGGGQWITIDSCLFSETKEAAALVYFQALGLDPAQHLKAIILTHWHDDHCKGMSRIIRAAPDAHICISSALTTKEFLTFSSRISTNKLPKCGTKMNEFTTIIHEIAERSKNGLINFSLATVRKPVFGVDSSSTCHGLPCEVIALSPSDGDVFRFLQRISDLMPVAKGTKRSISGATPNDVAVVTLIKFGDHSILLGADLENSGKLNAGWHGILSNHRQRAFGPQARLFKIAHHGSETAYNAEVWAELLAPSALSVLTPWIKGRGQLPTANGVKKILAHTKEAYTTSLEPSSRPRKDRPPAVKRQLRESGAKLKTISAEFGAVRFRMSDPRSGQWRTELFGAASQLGEYLRKSCR